MLEKLNAERIKILYKVFLRKLKKYFSTNILFLTYVFTSVFIKVNIVYSFYLTHFDIIYIL